MSNGTAAVINAAVKAVVRNSFMSGRTTAVTVTATPLTVMAMGPVTVTRATAMAIAPVTTTRLTAMAMAPVTATRLTATAMAGALSAAVSMLPLGVAVGKEPD